MRSHAYGRVLSSCWVTALEGIRLEMHVNSEHYYTLFCFIQFIWHAESCICTVFVFLVASSLWTGFDLKCMSTFWLTILFAFSPSSFDPRSHTRERALAFMLSQGSGRQSIWNAHQFPTWCSHHCLVIQFIWHVESCIWKGVVFHVESRSWKGFGLKCALMPTVRINPIVFIAFIWHGTHESGRVLSFMFSQGVGRDSFWIAHKFPKLL